MNRPALTIACLMFAYARADEMSADDKLRVVYSHQFSLTREGLPLTTIGIAEGRDRVEVAASGGLRVLPDGDGGAEFRGGNHFVVRVEHATPAKMNYHVVVATHAPTDSVAIAADLERWRERKFQPRSLELGALFALRGRVIDNRKVAVSVLSAATAELAAARARKVAEQYSLETSIEPELVERPHGQVVARGDSGAEIRNDSILWFAPADAAATIEVKDVDKEGGGKETRRYFGEVYVTLDRHGKLAVVNAVPEDKLLAGLVPAEMNASAPLEALKAQAVAARNELLAKIGTRHQGDPYRLCSKQHCQVYAGAGHEDARATAAVAATRGELLLRDAGGLIDAVYFSSCGGHTENNEKVWGGTPDPSLRGHFDDELSDEVQRPSLEGRLQEKQSASFCARPHGSENSFRWSVTLDLPAIANRLGVGRLKSIEVLERGVSGRAVKLRLVGDSAQKEVAGELNIRKALGGLKSSLFLLTTARDASGHFTLLRVDGAGHGHGVGMCQWGAIGMAGAGKKYDEILRHYYLHSHLEKFY